MLSRGAETIARAFKFKKITFKIVLAVCFEFIYFNLLNTVEDSSTFLTV